MRKYRGLVIATTSVLVLLLSLLISDVISRPGTPGSASVVWAQSCSDCPCDVDPANPFSCYGGPRLPSPTVVAPTPVPPPPIPSVPALPTDKDDSLDFGLVAATSRFSDVPEHSTYFLPVTYLVSRGWIQGYNNGTVFQPYNNATRAHVAKLVAQAIGATDPPGMANTFEDVPPDHPFYDWIENLARRGVMGGYPCGASDEPCVPPTNKPYFRPYNLTTRGQTAKIIVNGFNFTGGTGTQTFEDVPPSHTFYPFVQQISTRGIVGGYPCGTSPAGNCKASKRPYFLPSNNVNRGQLTKFVYNSLFNYNVATGGFDYDHVRTDNEYTPHSGSNNYECTAYEGSSNGCTSGNKTNPVGSFIVNSNTSRNQINDYNLVDRQLTWT